LHKPRNNSTILALETAIGGGSICVYRDNSELAFIAGDDSVSRSEELLPNIKALLAQVGIEPTEIDLVAVSRGPGSFTGIRIGLASALGLSRSLNIPCVGVPILDAIAAAHPGHFPLAVVLPMGKHEVVLKTFSLGLNFKDHGSVCSIDEIWSMIDDPATTALIHESLTSRLPDPPSDIHLKNLGYDLAEFVARGAHRWTEKIDLSPIYIQNPAKRSNLF
jgi:tRNA threonylcarbamoyl adenosine modification protein YeaZ